MGLVPLSLWVQEGRQGLRRLGQAREKCLGPLVQKRTKREGEKKKSWSQVGRKVTWFPQRKESLTQVEVNAKEVIDRTL